jgi:ligand-binding sensor domain-containing protein
MRKAAVRCLWVPLIAWMAVSAAQLPVKTYTTADGLPRDNINCIVQDARGFLWFCTSEGLSRFDGYTFTNYGTEHGLPNRAVNSLLVSRRGIYWAGTGAGLFRLDPNSTPPQKFETVHFGSSEHARMVMSLAEDRSGTLWVGTYGGLYRLEAGKTALELVETGIPKRYDGAYVVQALLVDRRGTLWIVGEGLYRRTPDGRTTAWPGHLSGGPVLAICEDRQGRIWVGDNSALYRLKFNAGPNDPTVVGKYNKLKGGLPANRIVALLETSDGQFWAGGFGGLGEYVPAADTFESYTMTEGLSDRIVTALAEDNEGNLWLGTDVGGVMKIARRGFTSYTQADGLGGTFIASIFVDQAGELCVVNSSGGKWSIDSFNGKRFNSSFPNYAHTYFGWGWNQHAFQDHEGEWWVPTGQGLYRFGKASRAEQLAGRTPKAVYTTRDGLPGNDIFRLFEDSRGDIWIANAGRPLERLTRWERATGSFRVYSAADGLPQLQHPATAFAEDRSGQLWIGFYNGELARFRNGHFTLYSEADGLPAGQIQALHLDHTGRLWIASNHSVMTTLIPTRGPTGTSDHGGLGRIDNPREAKPRVVVYTTAEGLSNNSVLCLTEDRWGRIYAGTGQGVDRLDPSTGRIKHYTTADGLARGDTRVAARDRYGALWFGSLLGLSRLVPEPDRPVLPPPILVTGLQVRGVSRPLAEFGESTVSGLVLQPNQNQLRIEFVGLGFEPGERLRYQYRLEGADRDWSPPGEQRAITYASLRPGSYTFQVRALNVEGAVSPQPASVTFTVLAPVWQRWWFLSAAGIAASLLIYALYRYRLAQLLAVERIRTRIAIDLHDDIGSSLSQVAILSEVVRRRNQRASISNRGNLPGTRGFDE